jgi:5-oxoprolinase (ATP-hydrolysing)
VHLGSLGICARLVKNKIAIGKGDVVITNHPKYGGSHLPDVTLLNAVYSTDNQLIGYVINRAHHAEIGGKRPGSMPPDAKNLVEEGVVIPPMYLVKNGTVQWQAIEDLLKNAPYPTRALAENLADINAALASLRTGEAALQKLAQEHGLEKVHRYMAALKQSATAALQTALKNIDNQTFTAKELLDDGHRICVKIKIQNGQIEIDFDGTSGVHPGNLNANISIVYSAVIYVLRLLCNKDIPLNEGLMQNVHIHLPTSFLHPNFSEDDTQNPAVVGGNTEVSQRLVDTLLKAFGLVACSQGTMNNFLFGNERFGYYETIGGGTGAGDGFPGRSAVHQHMTNTKITDPEELELRYPVRLQAFAIRQNSGGDGKWRGGDGIIRSIEFLEELDITILSQHRKEAPYGLEKGDVGMTGKQTLIRKNGVQEVLAGIASEKVESGDRLIIETPGGGGFGK